MTNLSGVGGPLPSGADGITSVNGVTFEDVRMKFRLMDFLLKLRVIKLNEYAKHEYIWDDSYEFT